MKRFLTESARPLLALLVFLIMQVLAGVAMVFIGQRLDMSRSMAICLGVANLVTIIAVWGIFRRSAPMDGASAALGWKDHLLALVGCCFGVVALDFCAEILDLPDMMEDMFIGLGSDPWGIVSIAIIGPVAEEVLFRWGIMRHYMPGGAWRAILISALAFGIIHMNPAQVPFAAAMGVLLGILFAMAFCPTSGLFYFGMLIPMSASATGGYAMPAVYALATGLPVVVVAWIIAYSIGNIAGFYRKMQVFQKWFNLLVAALFIIVGLYYAYTFYI